MSGIDALQGFDYQVSYALYKIVSFIKSGISDIDFIKFESVNEEEEDFNIIFSDGSVEFFQIKKRIESNMWTPSDIKKLLAHYRNNSSDNTRYTFITNGSANEDVKKLKKYIGGKKHALSKKELEKFIPDGCSVSEFSLMIKSVKIDSLVMASNSEIDTAEVVRKETYNLLAGASFFLKGEIETVYDGLWKYVFDASKQAKKLSYKEILDSFENLGLIKINAEEWLKFTAVNDFKGRNREVKEILELVSKHNKLSIFGISGIGKSYIMGEVSKRLNIKGENVCWLSFRANLTYEKFIKIIGAFIEQQVGNKMFCSQFEKKEIGDQINILTGALKSNKCLIFIDSYEAAFGNTQYFINNVFKNMQEDFLSSFVIATTNRNDLYSDADVKLGIVEEYIIHEFSYVDICEVYRDIGLTKEQIGSIWKNVGGFPIANTLLKEYVRRGSLEKVDFNELVELALDEKNKWLFDKIYKLLSGQEKSVLSYFSSVEYALSDYETIIIEKDLGIKMKHIIHSLINKNIVSTDGIVYYLHDVMRGLIYDELIYMEKNRIHKLFLETYEKRLFDFGKSKRDDDKFLSSKWGFHVSKLFDLNVLDDDQLNMILNMSKYERFDLWSIWWCCYPFEFDDVELISTVERVAALEDKCFIKKEGEHWIINKDTFGIKALYLIEYKAQKDFSAVAMGYVPILKPNFAFAKQRKTCCEWEHCIEFMPLGGKRDENSCPVFGHHCPDGSKHVQVCKENYTELRNRLGL